MSTISYRRDRVALLPGANPLTSAEMLSSTHFLKTEIRQEVIVGRVRVNSALFSRFPMANTQTEHNVTDLAFHLILAFIARFWPLSIGKSNAEKRLQPIGYLPPSVGKRHPRDIRLNKLSCPKISGCSDSRCAQRIDKLAG